MSTPLAALQLARDNLAQEQVRIHDMLASGGIKAIEAAACREDADVAMALAQTAFDSYFSSRSSSCAGSPAKPPSATSALGGDAPGLFAGPLVEQMAQSLANIATAASQPPAAAPPKLKQKPIISFEELTLRTVAAQRAVAVRLGKAAAIRNNADDTKSAGSLSRWLSGLPITKDAPTLDEAGEPILDDQRQIIMTNRHVAVFDVSPTMLSQFISSDSHYQALGVSRNATSAAIRAAFLAAALRHHPDREGIRVHRDRGEGFVDGGDDEDESEEPSGLRFMYVYEAYRVLSDPFRRRAYDDNLRRACVRHFLRRQTAAGYARDEERARVRWEAEARDLLRRQTVAGDARDGAEAAELEIKYLSQLLEKLCTKHGKGKDSTLLLRATALLLNRRGATKGCLSRDMARWEGLAVKTGPDSVNKRLRRWEGQQTKAGLFMSDAQVALSLNL